MLLASAARLLAPEAARQESNRSLRANLLSKLEELELRLRIKENTGSEALNPASPPPEEPLSAAMPLATSVNGREPRLGAPAGRDVDISTARHRGIAVSATTASCPQVETAERFARMPAGSPPVFAADTDSATFTRATAGNGCEDEVLKKLDGMHRHLVELIDAGLSSATAEIRAVRTAALSIGSEFNRGLHPDQHGSGELSDATAELAHRLDLAASGFATLTAIQNSIGELSAQLEETRRTVAAIFGPNEQVLRTILSSGETDATIQDAIASLRALHEETASRASFAWTSIQSSLEHVASVCARLEAAVTDKDAVPQSPGATSGDSFAPLLTRLAQHGGESAFQLNAEADAAPGNRQPTHGVSSEKWDSLGDADMVGFLIDPGHDHPGFKDSREPVKEWAPQPVPLEEKGDSARRPDFIAAARRAAQTAQLEVHGKRGTAADGLARETSEQQKIASLFGHGRGLRAWRRPAVLGSLIAAALVLVFTIALGTPFIVSRLNSLLPGFVRQVYGAAENKSPAAAQKMEPAPKSVNQTAAAMPSPGTAHAAVPSGDGSIMPGLPQQGARGGSALLSATPSAPLATPNGLKGKDGTSGRAPLAEPVIVGSEAIVASAMLPGSQILAPAMQSPPAAARMPIVPAPAVMPSGSPATDLLARAETGDPAAQFDLAAHYAEDSSAPGKLALAVQWYEKAAKQGHAVAQYRLASLYEKGHGVPKDLARAKELYQRAAEKGNIRAMHNLGVLAAEGSDGKPNYTSAALWFSKAAEYGMKDSQYNFAVLLARGLGVTKNLVRSYTWFAIVAASGDEDAARKRDDVATKLTSTELSAANAAAAAFVPGTPDRAANEPGPAPAPSDPAKGGSSPATAKFSGL
jgi:localization factor PodJL